MQQRLLKDHIGILSITESKLLNLRFKQQPPPERLPNYKIRRCSSSAPQLHVVKISDPPDDYEDTDGVTAIICLSNLSLLVICSYIRPGHSFLTNLIHFTPTPPKAVSRWAATMQATTNSETTGKTSTNQQFLELLQDSRLIRLHCDNPTFFSLNYASHHCFFHLQ